MSLACEIPANILEGGKAALFICAIECPVEKMDLKFQSKKTDVTSTASYYNGVIWDEFQQGATGASVSWDTRWRVNQQITPPQIRTGAIYPIAVYVRRPQATGPSDPGAAYTMNLFIDSSDLSFDLKNGTIDWKVSGSSSGPVTNPSNL